MLGTNSHSGKLISLSGSWGSGKTYTINSLREQMSECENWIVIAVDIFQCESVHDLHTFLYEQLLFHPRAFHLLWWRVGMSSLLSPIANRAWRFMQSARISIKGVEIEPRTYIAPAALTRQSELMVAISILRSKNRHILFILDELDRATPEVAQHTIAMLRRSLDLPGVSVVLSYVPEQIHYKVFNPLEIVSEDIAKSMQAVLWEHFFAQLNHSTSDRKPACESEITYNQASRSARESEKNSNTVPVNWAAYEHAYALHHCLLEQYMSCDTGTRRRLHFLFAEKYLNARLVSIPALGSADFIEVLRRTLDETNDETRERIIAEETGDVTTRLKEIKNDIESLLRDRKSRVPIRHLISRLDLLLGRSDGLWIKDRKKNAILLYLVFLLSLYIAENTNPVSSGE